MIRTPPATARPRGPRSTTALAAAAALAVLPVARHAAAATFTFANPSGGALNVSTNYQPAGVPGAADTVRIGALPTFGGPLALTLAANQTIGRLELDYFAQTTIAPQLMGNGQPYALTLGSGQLAFADAITESPGVALDALFLRAPIAGGAGLTKAGRGFANLSGNNLYTGGTTITGNGFNPAVGRGGLTVTSDANLGAPGGGVTLQMNGTLRATASFTTNRPITVGIGVEDGGRIESFGDLVLNGPISGTDPASGLFVGRYTNGSVTIAHPANPLAGGLSIQNGATVHLTGRLGAANSVRLAGTLTIGRGAVGAAGPVGAAADAINDAASISGVGGTLEVIAGAANTSERVGGVILFNGTTTFDLAANASGGAELISPGLVLLNRSTLFIRGRDLGAGPLAANRTVLNVGTISRAAPGNNLPVEVAPIGGGGTTATNDSIHPFLFGNANVTGGTSQVSAVDAGFVTVGPNGLRPLVDADYRTTLAVAATDNVRLSDGVFGQSGPATMNSLLIRDTMASPGNTGVIGGTLTITSGAIAAVSDLAGDELYIENAIQFGPREGVIHTAPTADGHAQLHLNGPLLGTGGLTKSGVGDLHLDEASFLSTYTGITTVNAGTIQFAYDVIAGQSGSLGTDASAVVINAGVTGNAYVGLLAKTPGSRFTRPILVRQSHVANSLALIGTAGGVGTTYAGQITVEGGLLNLSGDLEPAALTFSGNIVGAGGLQEPAVASPLPQRLRLTGNNTYAGGTVVRAGRWELGSDAALGTGVVFFEGNNVAGSAQTGELRAVGGPRTIANALVLRATPVFGGADALTLAGPVDLGGVDRAVDVTNAADTTFAGVVSRGGLTKRGAGRLILSGANAYNGQTRVAAGTLRVASDAALGAATGPAGLAQATFVTGTGTLEFAGGVTTNEMIFLGAAGDPVTLAAPAGNLRGVAGDNTIASPVAFDAVATVGVDAGATLTLAGDTLDNTPTATATLRKVGAGALTVKNVRLSAVRVDAGTLRVAPAGAPLGTSRTASLAIGPGATLDLTNNTLVYDYVTGSPIETIRLALLDGRIGTSVATPGAAIGYANASSLFAANSFPQSYAGQAIDDTTLLLTQTLRGDANLDRTVGFADLVTLAQNYNTPAGAVWRSGDFTYDGAVGFGDLVALAQNYNASAATASLDAFGTSFDADWALARSLVPEPATLGAAAALGGALARRRRIVRDGARLR